MNEYISVAEVLDLITKDNMRGFEKYRPEMEGILDLSNKERFTDFNGIYRDPFKLFKREFFLDHYIWMKINSYSAGVLDCVIYNATGSDISVKWYEVKETDFPRLSINAAKEAHAALIEISRYYESTIAAYRAGEISLNSTSSSDLSSRSGRRVLEEIYFNREAIISFLKNEEVFSIAAADRAMGIVDGSASYINSRTDGFSKEIASIDFEKHMEKGQLKAQELELVPIDQMEEHERLGSEVISENTKPILAPTTRFERLTQRDPLSISELIYKLYNEIDPSSRVHQADATHVVWVKLLKIAELDECDRPGYVGRVVEGGTKIVLIGYEKKPFLTKASLRKRIARLKSQKNSQVQD